jgi:hypothetical protein
MGFREVWRQVKRTPQFLDRLAIGFTFEGATAGSR